MRAIKTNTATTADTPQRPGLGADKARLRDRSATERRLVEAAVGFVERDGVLQGLNLRDVAEQAGVSRGHIYNYFGSRRDLLREALNRRWGQLNEFAEGGVDLPFAERKLRFFSQPDPRKNSGIALVALLVLDGDVEVDVAPFLEEQIERLEGDVADESIHVDHAVDLEALHIAVGALTRGYSIFRRPYARRLGIKPEALDQRVAAVVESWLHSLSMPKPSEISL